MSSASSRSSDERFGTALRSAVDVVAAAIAASPWDAAVLIDGRSGSGKSTLASALQARAGAPTTLIRLDSLYPGWDGLDAGVRMATDGILTPHARRAAGRWTEWDWNRGAPGREHVVPADTRLIVDGSGILTPETAALASVRVWLESPEPSRRQRALTRDGDTYRPHWQRWALQEERHIVRDDPQRWATHRFEVP